MDPSRPGPSPFPHGMSPPPVRRNLSAESRPFAPATAAAAMIPTTRQQQQQQPAAAVPSTPPAAAQPQPLQTPTRRVAPPVKSTQPYPEATPETVLPALVPRLTALLPLHELNIFLQASRRHLSAMEFLGSLKGLALRHPRDSGNSNNQQNQAKDTSQAPPPQAAAAAAAAAAPATTTPPPLKVLARFRRGLTTLRLADRRVLPYLFLGVHQKLCSGIVTLVLRDLNMAEEDLLRLGVLLGKPHLLPALAHLHLGGRNRFTDNGLAAFAALGLNPSTPTPATTAGVAPQARTQPPAPGLQTLDLGGNGFTLSAQALEALAGAFEARFAVLLPPTPDVDDDDDDGHKTGEEEVKKASPGVGGGGGGRDKGTGVVGLRKLVLGQWCWGPRPSPSTSFPTKQDEESKGINTSGSITDSAALLQHPLRRLLTTPAVAATLEELDLLQARLLPGEVRALALALQDGSHRRLRLLRLGLDPDAFASASTGGADEGEQKQQEEAAASAAVTSAASSSSSSSSLLLLFAALQAGCCPRLTTLDIDGRVVAASSPSSSSPVVGPLGGGVMAALDAAVRGGRLRRLESLRLARCALGANELSQLLVALHAAALLPTATSSSSKQGGLRALSLEGNPALGEYGVQVLAMCIREGTLPQLHSLTIDGAGSGDNGLRDLAVAFESVALSQRGSLPLTALSLAGNDLTAEGVAWLGRALTAGALPKLESLSLANNSRIGADGGRYLATFLLQMQQQQPATACRIKALDLRWTELGVGGAEALALAVEKGACPALDRLQLAQGPNAPWSTETRAALHKLRDALLARSDPSPSSATEGAMQQQTGQQVSTYVARRRAGAARRRAAAGGGPRVSCL